MSGPIDIPTVSPTLAEFPTRPTKDQVLTCLMEVLEDLADVYDAVDAGGEDMLVGQEVLLRLLRGHTRTSAVRGALGTLAVLEAKRLLAWGTSRS